MPLTEIELRLPGEALEAFGDALLELGALSVSAADALADTDDEAPLYGEPGMEPPAAWGTNRVAVLLAPGTDVGALLAGAARRAGCPVPAALRVATLDDQDWVTRTQSQFAPVLVGRLAIVPSWHEPPAGHVAIRLDPGVAFGTGTHPTTRLCLAWLERELSPGARVLDYGCGSGILSIAACALGAGEVLGIDIDPQAVAAARANAGRNGVAARYTGADGDLPADARFDLVIANILANPLVVLAPALAPRVVPGGRIVLSGILERQAGEVAAAYARVDPAIALAPSGHEDGWVVLCGTRPG